MLRCFFHNFQSLLQRRLLCHSFLVTQKYLQKLTKKFHIFLQLFFIIVFLIKRIKLIKGVFAGGVNDKVQNQLDYFGVLSYGWGRIGINDYTILFFVQKCHRGRCIWEVGKRPSLTCETLCWILHRCDPPPLILPSVDIPMLPVIFLPHTSLSTSASSPETSLSSTPPHCSPF